MSTLLTDDPPHPNATYSGLMLVEELLRLKRIAENKRLAQEAVAKHRGRPDSVPHVGGPITDVHANPRESRCSEARLQHILAERDEYEARQAARTVRPVNGDAA